MNNFTTSQEEFWAGEFGNAYIDRNNSKEIISSNVVLFSKILSNLKKIDSVLELGCNVGLNLDALSLIDSNLSLSGVELNEEAAKIAASRKVATIHQKTIVEPLDLGITYDLTFTKTVLIHINPARLHVVYENLVNHSNRYILISEYYNPTPVAIEYRGHSDKLFKRDFAGELISSYGLSLVKYGFSYRRDKYLHHQDDASWFLLEK
jgi:pseudaminic acid biosynthesis-associated methylase